MEDKKSYYFKSKKIYYDQYLKRLARNRDDLLNQGKLNLAEALECLRVSSMSDMETVSTLLYHHAKLAPDTKRISPSRSEVVLQRKNDENTCLPRGIQGRQIIPMRRIKKYTLNDDSTVDNGDVNMTALHNLERLKLPAPWQNKFANKQMEGKMKRGKHSQTTFSELLHLVIKSSVSIPHPVRGSSPQQPDLILKGVSQTKTKTTNKQKSKKIYFRKPVERSAGNSSLRLYSLKEKAKEVKKAPVCVEANNSSEVSKASIHVLPSVNDWSPEAVTHVREMIPPSQGDKGETDTTSKANALGAERQQLANTLPKIDSSDITKYVNMEDKTSCSILHLNITSNNDERSLKTIQPFQKRNASKVCLLPTCQPRNQTNYSETIQGESSDFQVPVSGVIPDLKKPVSEVNADSKKPLPEISPELKKSLSGVSSDLKKSLSGVSSDLKKSLSGVSSDLKKSLSADLQHFKKSVSEVSLQTESFPSASSSDKNKLNQDKLSQSSNISVDRADNSLPDIEQTTSRKSDSYASESRLTTPEQYYEEDMIKLPDIHSSNQLTNQRFQDF